MSLLLDVIVNITSVLFDNSLYSLYLIFNAFLLFIVGILIYKLWSSKSFVTTNNCVCCVFLTLIFIYGLLAIFFTHEHFIWTTKLLRFLIIFFSTTASWYKFFNLNVLNDMFWTAHVHLQGECFDYCLWATPYDLIELISDYFRKFLFNLNSESYYGLLLMFINYRDLIWSFNHPIQYVGQIFNLFYFDEWMDEFLNFITVIKSNPQVSKLLVIVNLLIEIASLYFEKWQYISFCLKLVYFDDNTSLIIIFCLEVVYIFANLWHYKIKALFVLNKGVNKKRSQLM